MRQPALTVKRTFHGLYSIRSPVVRTSKINGGAQADGGIYVRVNRTNVSGDIQLEEVSGEVSRVQRSSIDDNLQLDNNRVRLVAEYNTIDGKLAVQEQLARTDRRVQSGVGQQERSVRWTVAPMLWLA
ncbi:MAG TPA: hypothetical protein PK201_07540 [Accumulibacter sp.]|nr:hypothetical protein [Accumulibacter sp.]